MAGETSLTTLLRSMSPQLNEGTYVFCSLSDAAQLQGIQPLGDQIAHFMHDHALIARIVQRASHRLR